jgi:anti-anti-sigma factor
MDVENQGLRKDGGAVGRPAGRKDRDTLSGSPPTSLELARAQRERGYSTYGDAAMTEGHQAVVPGELAVRWERQDSTLIMWLSGSLDQATVTLIDRELDARTIGTMCLVVDLTGLEFIDSPGLDALVGINWRASKRGDRLTFRHGSQVAQRPIELTRTVRLRSRWATAAPGATDDDPYFALAMACVDVDHPRSGDRPEAA